MRENHLNLNKRGNYVPLPVQREALIEYMTKVINYVRENISGAFKKNDKTPIAKEVAEVADFLIAVEQVNLMYQLMTNYLIPTYKFPLLKNR